MVTRHISAEVSEEVYERFQRAKKDVAADGEATNAKTLSSMVSRWNGTRRERPAVLGGVKPRINVPMDRKIYVGINTTPADEPFEVFISGGSSGGQFNAYNEALAKTISNALRAGVDLEVIADDLMGIRGPYAPAVDNGDDIYSIPDGVGIALKRFVTGNLDPPQPVRNGGDEPMGVRD